MIPIHHPYRNQQKQPLVQTAAPQSRVKAQVWLLAACIWPLVLLALFASSASHNNSSNSSTASSLAVVRNVLDRVDIVGYGSTHPRVAFVVTGSDPDLLYQTCQNIVQNTDMNRFFVLVVSVIMDSNNHNNNHMDKDKFQHELQQLASGSVTHYHGNEIMKGHDDMQDDHDHPHAGKVHVLWNTSVSSIAQARHQAVEFVQILEQTYEQHGMKSTTEEILLVFLHDATSTRFRNHHWLSAVTQGLIVPPPVVPQSSSQSSSQNTVSLQLANAIVVDEHNNINNNIQQRTSFDMTLSPIREDIPSEELNASNNESYMVPVMGPHAILILRLHTYLDLPFVDLSSSSSTDSKDDDDIWAANLNLSLNLWLCGDGMDAMVDVYGQPPSTSSSNSDNMKNKMISVDVGTAPLTTEQAARMAAAWMDERTRSKFFPLYTSQFSHELTRLEWDALLAKSTTTSMTTPPHTQCRSFLWYAQHVNTNLQELLQVSSSKTTKDESIVKDVPPVVIEEKKEIPTPKEEKVEKAKKNDQGDEAAIEAIIPERREVSSALRPVNVDIVSRAKPVDITFVDVSNGYKEHPHMGAKDEDGNFGYIHDETALHKNPPAFNPPPDELKMACMKRDNNYRMLTEKVKVDFKTYSETMAKQPPTKLFCLVYTTEKGHPAIPRIRETWG